MSVAKMTERSHAKVNFSALAFYREFAGIYQDIWSILGRQWNNLASETVWSRDTIPGKDHGLLKIELTNQQREALLPLLSTMGFFRACRLNRGTYDELDITGAKYDAMRRRIKAVVDRMADPDPRQQVSFGRIVGLFGHRPRTDWQDGSVETIYAGLSDAVKQHPWVQEQMALMQLPDPTAMWNGAFATEHELGILAFIVATDGNIAVEPADPFTDETSLPGIPPRLVASRTLRLSDGTPVIVLNAPAVTRPHGDPRPTTISTTEYWLSLFTPVRGGRVVALSGKTHWYRVIGDFERLLHRYFHDITVCGMSESAGDSGEVMAVINNALAEAVWLLQKAYEELLECLKS